MGTFQRFSMHNNVSKPSKGFVKLFGTFGNPADSSLHASFQQ